MENRDHKISAIFIGLFLAAIFSVGFYFGKYIQLYKYKKDIEQIQVNYNDKHSEEEDYSENFHYIFGDYINE